jgi:hypothetical protein
MKGKIIGIVVLIFCFTQMCLSQSETIQVEYTKTAKLTINELSLNTKTKVEELTKILGEPSKTADYPNGETSYFYEDQGIVFFTKGGLVKVLGINFNWDGDEKFPQKSFAGSLTIGELSITADTESDAIAEIESIAFVCPMPSMCASEDRSARINCMVGFKNERLSQQMNGSKDSNTSVREYIFSLSRSVFFMFK